MLLGLLGLLSLPLSAARAGEPIGVPCPPAGSDSFESDMNVLVDITGIGMESLILQGPVTVTRSAARRENGIDVIDTEIVAMSLTGEFMQMPVTLRVNPEESSLGEVRAQGPATCFPADSFFDVFVEIQIGALDPMVNLEPVRLQAGNLLKLPPLFDTYTHPPPSIPLVAKGTSGPVLATIEGESSHGPVQDPTFSIAAGGMLEPATGWLVPRPNTEGLSRSGLGLVDGDELNGISFGRDSIDVVPYTTLAFSVDPSSAGSPGSGVAQEAVTGEQESAEYVTFVNGSNQLLVEGSLLVPQTGNPGDDVDALVDQPASRVDTNDDQIPDQPVFITLAPGSPTLTALTASAGDILVTVGGMASIFATAADIGLQAGDDIDALCLMKTGLPGATLRPGSGPPAPPPPGAQTFDYMLFSLASGSPTLASQSRSSADIFVTDFSDSRPSISNDLVVYASASAIGVLASDEVNALKCLTPSVMIEITGDGDLDPDNDGSGCEDTEVQAGVFLDVGLANHDGNPLAVPAVSIGLFGFFSAWTVQNPAAGDYHGPYGYPGSGAESFMPTGDPAQLNFVGGPTDNCGLPHIHGGSFGLEGWDRFGFHDDPDGIACGHGVFIPSPFPIYTIPTRRSEVPVVAQQMVDLLNSLTFGAFQVSWHRYDGPTTVEFSECTDLTTRRAVLIFTGLSVTQFNIAMLGLYSGDDLTQPPNLGPAPPASNMGAPLPVRFGPPMRSFAPMLVPEPTSPLLWISALGVLGWLANRRRD